jgi:hypothetical protein
LLVYSTVGTLMVSNRRGNAVGRVLCGMGFVFEFLAVFRAYADYPSFAYPARLPDGQALEYVSGWTAGPGIASGADRVFRIIRDSSAIHRVVLECSVG